MALFSTDDEFSKLLIAIVAVAAAAVTGLVAALKIVSRKEEPKRIANASAGEMPKEFWAERFDVLESQLGEIQESLKDGDKEILDKLHRTNGHIRNLAEAIRNTSIRREIAQAVITSIDQEQQ